MLQGGMLDQRPNPMNKNRSLYRIVKDKAEKIWNRDIDLNLKGHFILTLGLVLMHDSVRNLQPRFAPLHDMVYNPPMIIGRKTR